MLKIKILSLQFFAITANKILMTKFFSVYFANGLFSVGTEGVRAR